MNVKKQAGMTGIGWLVVVFIIGFFVLIAFTIIPLEIEAYKVKSAVAKLQHVPYVTKMSREDIIKHLQKQFHIDDVDSVKDKHIKVTKKEGVMVVSIKYERRTTVISPYDLIGTFESEVKVVTH